MLVPFLVLLLALFLGVIMRSSMNEASIPRCGDCRQRMPESSGTCPACGGRRG